MGGFVFDQGNLNTAALSTPGAYVQLIPPAGLEAPGLSNAVGFLGSGSWGPVNVLQGPFGEQGSINEAIGQFDANLFLTDKYDLARPCMQALEQAQIDGALSLYLNRISDGTDAAATVALNDVTSGTALLGMNLPAKWTGIGGNTIKVSIAATGINNMYNVTVTASFSGALRSELFLNIQGSASGASPFWANFAAAIANGNDSRGPSELLGTPTSVSTTALNPAVGTFSLAGGTDGRSGLTSASYFGSDVVGNRQGIYAFRNMNVVPAYIYCAGLTDLTKAANVNAFINQEIIRYVFPLAAGTSTSSAVSTRNSTGIASKRFMYAKDWIYWSDPISGKLLFSDPVAIMIGRAASLSPQLSPLNKSVFGVVASEQKKPYPADEVGLLNGNGIWALANPCLGRNFWGFISASTTSFNLLEQMVEYARLQDYIGLNFARILTKFVGEPQGTYDPDETRVNCKNDIDSVMALYKESKLIQGWESQVDAKNNNPQSIARGYLRGKLKYLPFWTVKYVLLDLATTLTLSPAQVIAQSEQNS